MTTCKHPVACGGPHRAVASDAAALLPTHKQTWSASWATVYRNDDEAQGWTIQVPVIHHYEDGCPYETSVELFFDDHENVARLASAAPEMARVLLAIVARSEDSVSDLGDCLGHEIRQALVDALEKAGITDGLPTDGDWSPESRAAR